MSLQDMWSIPTKNTIYTDDQHECALLFMLYYYWLYIDLMVCVYNYKEITSETAIS